MGEKCIFKDETGKKYGELTVIKRCYEQENGNGAKWLCKCDCGNMTVVSGDNLRRGTTTSCGCKSIQTRDNFLKKIKIKYKTSFFTKDNCLIGVTSQGDEFILDLDDYDKVKNFTWRVSSNGYIVTTNNQKVVLLHRLIMNPSEDLIVDHINHNTPVVIFL